MNVSLRSKTTVGQLFYPARPSLNFSRLVADLDAALAGAGASDRKTTLERDGLAVIDTGASRIAVAMAENLDTAGATAITVTVGLGPEDEGDGDVRLARRQAVLARLIADKLAARSEPAETIWSESPEVATPEFLERSVEDLAIRRRSLGDSRAARAQDGTLRHFVGSEDLPRLVAKVDATLDARRAGWDGSLGLEASDLPPVDLTGLEEATADQKPVSAPLRLAAHLIDATLMVVLLPVGAAMMVYSLSRGANLNTSARAMALTGVGMSLVQSAGGLGGLGQLLKSTI